MLLSNYDRGKVENMQNRRNNRFLKAGILIVISLVLVTPGSNIVANLVFTANDTILDRNILHNGLSSNFQYSMITNSETFNLDKQINRANGRQSSSSNWLGDVQITDNPDSSEFPSIKVDSSGNVHIVWHDDRDGNWEIYYKKLDNNGNELVLDTRLTYDIAVSKYPSLDVDSSGGVHIVWQDNRFFGTEMEYEIYYTKLDNNGDTLVDDLQLTEFDFVPSLYPSIMLSDTDNVHTAWQDMRDGNWEIYYKKLDNDGSTLMDATRISDQTNNSEQPSLAVYDDTRAYISWQDDRDGNYEIYYDDAVINLIPVNLSYESSDPDKPYLAQVEVPLTIEAVIDNIGNIVAIDVRVDILLDDTVIYTEDVPFVAPGYSRVVSFMYVLPPDEVGHHWLSVQIDPEQEVDEYNHADNELTKYMPVPDVVEDYIEVDVHTMYTDTIIACSQLFIDYNGELTLENTTLIMYGDYPMIDIAAPGELTVEDSVITTSHPSEYIYMFLIPEYATFSSLNSSISQVGGTPSASGIQLYSPNVEISGCIIENSAYSAIMCYDHLYNFDNLTIVNSGEYDFNLNNATLNVIDSFFDREKVRIDDPESIINYYKHIKVIFRNETGVPVENALVEIWNVFDDLIFSGDTNENGEIPVQLLQVYYQTMYFIEDYAPYNVTGEEGTIGFDSTLINVDAMFGTGGNGYCLWGSWSIVDKYALMIAGIYFNHNETTPTLKWYVDRSAAWNDIEYLYSMLTKLYGYKAENIIVLFMDGKDYNGNANPIINGSATKANVEWAIEWLGNHSRNDDEHKDTILIYTSDHGGHLSGHSNICLQGLPISDYDFANLIEQKIGNNYSKMYIVMNQCHGGGFIDDLHADNRVVITATKKLGETSWYYWCKNDDNKNDGHFYFGIEFLSAFHGFHGGYPNSNCGCLSNYMSSSPTDYYLNYPAGNPYHVNPLQNLDDDSNGIISFHEAFDYGRDNDLVGPVDGRRGEKEHPQEVDDDVVVVACYNGPVFIYWYDGDGTLSGKRYDISWNHVGVFVHDMDIDDNDDIVIVDYYNDRITVLLNNGSWEMTSANYTVGYMPSSLYVANLNSDSYPDVVTTNNYDNDISILFNNGDGTLGNRKDIAIADTPFYVSGAKIDNGNSIDLVISNDCDVDVLFNDGSGSFPQKTTYTFSGKPKGHELGDIDDDGDNDLLVGTSGYGQAEIHILKNNGGVFSPFDKITGYSSFKLADLDNDGFIDLMIFSGNRIRFYKNDGNGNFNFEGQELILPHSRSGIFTTDLDGDDDLDIIVGAQENVISVFLNQEGTFKFDSAVDTYDGIGGVKSIHGTNHNHPRGWYP